MYRVFRVIASAVVVFGTNVCFLSSLQAAEGEPAITDITQTDADFLFQGEYVGCVLLGSGERQQIGLQVVPLGDGKFFAVEFGGGVPGAGGSGGARIRLEAERKGDALVFVHEPLHVRVENGVATFTLQPQDLQIAQLTKTYRVSPTLGAKPPEDAIVLFDGTNTDHFENGRMTEDGLLMVGTQLKQGFRDYTLHVEFRLPYMPKSLGQKRSNSGVYLQSRYEVQVLDSFGLEGVENECGALYRQRRPEINMCLPPLTWQTYDIDFRAPRFDDEGNKIANARITVCHNGVVIHDDAEIIAKTGAGAAEAPTPLPIKFQDHGNPVVFRNIWLVDKSGTDDCPELLPCCPVQCSR